MKKQVLVIYSVKRFVISMLVLLFIVAAAAGLGVYGHMSRQAKNNSDTGLLSMSYSVCQM